MNIGDVIASSRRRKGINQKKMAEDLKISVSYLSQIENNSRTPSPKLLSQIAEKLDLPISILLFEAMNDSNLTSKEDRKVFIKAKHLMDKMISFFVS